MSDNKNFNPAGENDELQELDFSSFFSQFEDLEADEPQEQEAPVIPTSFDPADTSNAVPSAAPDKAAVFDPASGNDDFLSDARKELDELLASITAPSALFGEEEPAAPAVEEISVPVVEESAPVAEVSAPVAEVSAPVAEVSAPVAEVSAPVAEVSAPVAEVSAPVAEVSAPVAEVSAPVAEVSAPVTEVSAPVAEVSAPVAEVSAPVAEVSAPVAEVSAPVIPAAIPGYQQPDEEEAAAFAPVVSAPVEAFTVNVASKQPAAPEKTEKAEKAGKKKLPAAEIVRRTVLALSIITIIGSIAFFVYTYFVDPILSERKNQQASDLIDVIEIPAGTLESEKWAELEAQYPDIDFPPDMNIRYASLYTKNTDLAGWISIDEFGIDLPLVQGSDNSYYLSRDVYKKRTEYGVPFFDYRNNLYFLDRNTVVYGHNMRYSDLIFGMLEDYKTVNGFKKAPTIQCNTIYDELTWKVYAVFITNSDAKADNGYVFNYNFTALTDEKFSEYITHIDKRALYKTGVDILPTDKILTLSTCCYDFDSAKLVVVARLLRDGESADVDTSLAVTNPNPKYPQAWYDANNKTNPYVNDEKWYA